MSTLYEQYAGSMRAVGYRVLGDVQLAEDVAQETFARALANRATIDEQVNIGGWLYTIAYRISIDLQRKRKREFASYTDELPLIDGRTPEQTVVHRETQSELWQTVDSLGSPTSKPLKMFYHFDWPLQQIADQLDVSVPALKSRLHRAKITLRHKLEASSPF